MACGRDIVRCLHEGIGKLEASATQTNFMHKSALKILDESKLLLSSTFYLLHQEISEVHSEDMLKLMCMLTCPLLLKKDVFNVFVQTLKLIAAFVELKYVEINDLISRNKTLRLEIATLKSNMAEATNGGDILQCFGDMSISSTTTHPAVTQLPHRLHHPHNYGSAHCDDNIEGDSAARTYSISQHPIPAPDVTGIVMDHKIAFQYVRDIKRCIEMREFKSLRDVSVALDENDIMIFTVSHDTLCAADDDKVKLIYTIDGKYKYSIEYVVYKKPQFEYATSQSGGNIELPIDDGKHCSCSIGYCVNFGGVD